MRHREIPEEYKEQAKNTAQQLVEAVAELDEELMMKYLEGEELTVEEIRAGIRKGTCRRRNSFRCFVVLPIKNKGVQSLLDAVVDYMPSPLDVPAIQGTLSETGS